MSADQRAQLKSDELNNAVDLTNKLREFYDIEEGK